VQTRVADTRVAQELTREADTRAAQEPTRAAEPPKEFAFPPTTALSENPEKSRPLPAARFGFSAQRPRRPHGPPLCTQVSDLRRASGASKSSCKPRSAHTGRHCKQSREQPTAPHTIATAQTRQSSVFRAFSPTATPCTTERAQRQQVSSRARYSAFLF
jgi:hypothetical protein